MTEQSAAQPRLLAEIDRLLDAAGAADHASEPAGALWRLAEDERQLDANVIRLPAQQRIEVHREPDVDVLLVVLAGDGTVHTDGGALALAPHALLWLPHGSQRAIEAGSRGLAYLTVHRKRTGMRIGLPGVLESLSAEALRRLEAREEEAEGGEPACLLPRLCPECGAPNERSSGQACSTCGAELTR